MRSRPCALPLAAQSDTTARRRLVLIGGGHAHLELLRRWVERPVAGVRLRCVFDHPHTIYSGMVPGQIARLYPPGAARIDTLALATRAGADVTLAPCTGIATPSREVVVAGGQRFAFDVLSLDVGSRVRGIEGPDAPAHAIPTRPVAELLDRVEDALKNRMRDALPINVVGAGAAGLEVAFALHARARREGMTPHVRVVDRARDLLPNERHPTLRRRIARALARRGIETALGFDVVRCDANALHGSRGERLDHAVCIWASGAAAHPWIAQSGLPVDRHGFALVTDTLEVPGCPGVFCVGDCAALQSAPWLPKAGVYAVRAAPILDANVRARLQGRSPRRRFTPQRTFLRLLNLGNGRAIGARGHWCMEGRWLWWLKDRIDRRFIRRFRIAP